MNCPSRTDEIEDHPDWNQNPHNLSSDLTTRADLNGIVNLREKRVTESSLDNEPEDIRVMTVDNPESPTAVIKSPVAVKVDPLQQAAIQQTRPVRFQSFRSPRAFANKVVLTLQKYAGFVGPGFLIAVAYIDPGNYATDVEAGAATKYRHLFIVLMSNLFAIFLQSLCIKLGSVTGLNLAENCRKHLPKWLNFVLYLFAESAIIATDIAEVSQKSQHDISQSNLVQVIGSAIALNLLLHIPLVAGCAITLVDVLILLIFYRPNGSMMNLRLFEYFVMSLVVGVMVCFCIQLSYIRDTSTREVFKGYLPSSAIVEGNGIYLSCGIIGATVMPHSIFLGSGVVQPRLKDFDQRNGHITSSEESEDEGGKYIPSIYAIRACLKYSIVELATSLFTFALFVNSAILIVSGSSLYPKTEATDADLFGIYRLLSDNLSRAAGTIFALALLLSGTSAGIVCTMAGQMVSEGMLHWTLKPWLRRLITRAISIVPSIVIAGAIGREGLNAALTASQVVLSVILPFVTAPLLWFTCRSHIMTVQTDGAGGAVNMRNGWVVTILATTIWLVLVVMNVSLLVLVGLGKA